MRKLLKILVVILAAASLSVGIIQAKTSWFTDVQNRFSSFKNSFRATAQPEELPQSKQTLPGPLRAEKPSAQTAPKGKINSADIIRFTNEERVLNGLTPYKENLLLKAAAQKKLSDMFAKQYFEHVSPSGTGPSDVVASTGYDYILVGENLALGNFSSSRDMVDGWMNSPGHRANILHFGFTEIGVAVGQGKFEGKTVWIGVQSFGKPASDCPEIDQALKQRIEQNQTRIYQLEEEAKAKRTELESGVFTTPEPYNSKVGEYNDLVEELNALVELTRAQVDQYNEQVREFNACAGEHA